MQRLARNRMQQTASTLRNPQDGFELSGNSIAYFRDGKIFELVDEISDELAIAAQVALQRQQAGE